MGFYPEILENPENLIISVLRSMVRAQSGRFGQYLDGTVATG